MLKLRLASGLGLAAVMIAAIVYLPDPWLAAFLLVLALVAVREWAKLAGIETRVGWIAYATVVSATVAALWLATPEWRQGVLVCGAVFWLGAGVVVLAYPRSRTLLQSKPTMVVLGILIVASTWLALVEARTDYGPGVLIWLLAAAAAADIGAYFAGHRFGRRKLAPQISPGKTWEGFAGGGLATLAWGVAGAALFAADLAGAVVSWLGMAAVLFLASVTGDLFESAFKRARGVKNSGAILPGHGGMLDRIDSVVATAPVFVVLAPVVVGPI